MRVWLSASVVVLVLVLVVVLEVVQVLDEAAAPCSLDYLNLKCS